MSIEVVRYLPEKDWADFVNRLPAGNIFHTPEMYKVFSRAENFSPELWAAVDNGKIMALLMPVFINLFSSPLLKRFTTRAVCFGSALFAAEPSGSEGLLHLLTNYSEQARKKAIFTELRNISNLESVESLMGQCGFRFEDHLNYLISLEPSYENVFKRIGPRTRKNIKRIMKKELVEIKEVSEVDELKASYNLLEKTYGRASIPLADFSLFKSAFEVLFPKKMIRITLAKVKGWPAAVSFDLLYKKRIYAWYGGVDRQYSSYLPNELLTWDILRWGCQNGFELYDFGGAGRPGQKYGVRDFKAKFGGQQINYGRFVKIHSKLIYYLDIVLYNIFRQILFKNK